MIARFFINHPIFAWVISLLIMLVGILSIKNLPVEQYPDIAPPTINIQATYSGATAKTIENSITQLIEQELTGLDGLLYFSSTSQTGSSSINVVFEKGVDPDIAQVKVNNKIQQVLPRLPEDVRKEGVTVVKSQDDFLMIVSMHDESGKSDESDISDYLITNIKDGLSRIDGVGGVELFGSEYAMRVWIDPKKLKSYNLIPSDINNAILKQNAQVSAGSIGSRPQVKDQELNADVVSRDKLKNVKEFENIVVKSNKNGADVFLKDVAKVELGSNDYSFISKNNGYQSSGIGVKLSAGANAVDVAKRVREYLSSFENSLPSGYVVSYPYDTTIFIEESIKEVVKTLFEAIFLVVVVMFVFLNNWRATIIPAIAVPVVLLGTFAILNFLGFTINSLTMFAMVLSIGLLVDDAIVVVENVERNMREKKLCAKEATIIAMQEITSALIGVATVLSVVFLPMIFFTGSTGIIYKQFAVTIISSMVLSVVVALTLSPAICATFLKPHNTNKKSNDVLDWFNKKFGNLTKKYKAGIFKFINAPFKSLVAYMVIIAVSILFFIKLPTGFIPPEDQGDLMIQFTLPAGASATRSENIEKIIRDYFLTEEKNNINSIFSIVGFTFSGNGQNGGLGFVELKNWDKRVGIENSADSIANRAMMNFADNRSKYFIRDAQVFVMNPSSVPGLGNTDGFEFQLQAGAKMTRDDLIEAKDSLLKKVNSNQLIINGRVEGTEETPQLKLDYDKKKIFSLGLSYDDIDDTLNTAWAGSYVNDFIDKSRIKRVYVQADAQYRSKPEDLYQWNVRNNQNKMVSFEEFTNISWKTAEKSLTRYNGLASYLIQGEAATGVSSGLAMDEMERLAKLNNKDTKYSWSGLSYHERLSSGQAVYLYALSLVVIFLCLAALYESWSIPFSVLLAVPLGVIGAVLAVYFRGLNNDIYFQVALLTTIGLVSKNAILIVEFVENAYKKGESLTVAAVEGATLRFRPIIMTSLAFIAGIIPLAISTGAGANSRISIGTGIIGGTLTATVLAIFYVPLLFILVKKVFSKKEQKGIKNV
ncbi:hydrophobe/amphiphile efflux-1 family RND transporter [Malaciobacter molluscorum LMG 25693]|uniref:Hydrophobe/amphiphile efflux-1 family RND transporter n=1 Tax=Malaciobacter molluscorum LMG 25693 TaxID=870501 RepID=A0A2G1DLJ2_9BACT|nr:efflux RND transporter permease subunit [Malaciobacter molluscorum]AXX92149.1 RND family efflux system, inner membrane transporter, AcrB family [Malaciobacter molluscorum LMG 25693]PHO19378.1 hydrophobe/amphiphile efflux-1 family RND transporter [Malaciobacter molluscorum LMG 25693]